MAPQQSMKLVVYDDRKRLRESIREAELSASPKKGKHQDVPDSFSFPAFDAPLAEIAQQCHATGLNESAEPNPPDNFDGDEVLRQYTPAVFQLWQAPGCAAGAQNTPEPQGILSFDKQLGASCQNTTPALAMADKAATRHVQTLKARAMPLSPFECGDIPDQQSVDENIATPTSAIIPTLPDGNEIASDGGLLSSPGAPTLGGNADYKLTQLREAEDLQNQFAMVQDVSLTSQNASQSSSLAETKILRLSNRLMSKDASESSHCSFKFSKAFTFHGLLGDTKTSTVYFAQATDGLFAIKEMKRPFISKADRADMMRELRAVYALPIHPNVVNYVRFWQEGRKLHIQMELCEGGSLDTLLKRSEICQDEKVPEDVLWLILSDAVNGLQHIHTHGVLHMDIKPENMFLDSSGIFKLGDFGIAINVTNQAGWEEGDGRYVAPELLQRSRPTGAADVYSLGATMIHCSIGTSLPMERSPQTVRRHLAGHGYSVEFQHIVASMVAASPEDRPTSEMLCSVLQRKRTNNTFEAIRQKLSQVAEAVHAQRMVHQRKLHCSPSFSLSQSVDNATPGSVGQPAAGRPERVWSQLFSVKSRSGARNKNGIGCSPGSSLPVDRAPMPPAPPVRAAALVEKPALVGRGHHPPPRVGTPPSVLPKLHQHQPGCHRSPSAGSFDRCGALSYSSNGQASGSLNLELYPEFGTASGQGDATTTVRLKAGMRTEDTIPQQQRMSMLRPAPFHGRARAGRSHARGPNGAGQSRTPLTLIVPERRDHVQPSPRSDVLHRYFSSQAQEDISLRSQVPLPNVSTAALSQVEVTGPCEADLPSTTSAVRKPRQRRAAAPRPPDLHELKHCLASCRPAEHSSATLRAASKTKGRAMVWKGLQDVTSSSAAALQGVVSGRGLVAAPDQLARPTPVKFGQGPARRSRGAKIAGVASGMVSRGQENNDLAANVGHFQIRNAGPARPRDFPQSVARLMQPYQSKLRAVKTLHVSKARELSTEILASSRPELKQPLAVCHSQNLGV